MANVKPVSDADGSLLEAPVSRENAKTAGVGLSGLEASLVRMVLYFDVFEHPLRQPELERLVAPGDTMGVAEACDRLARKGLVEVSGPWVGSPGRMGAVPKRRERAACAEATWPTAMRAAKALACLPYVQGLFVTGGLSKNSASPCDDIDFLVLVAPGRVWTLKSLLQLLRRPLPGVLRECLCTNYLVATDTLLVDDRNLFTAVELATAVPVFGREACVAFLEANAWTEHFVPGRSWSVARARSLPPGPPVVTTPPRALGRTAEAMGRAAWSEFWDRKYRWLSPAERSQRFKRQEGRATNHLHDFQSYVLGEVASRLARAGVHETLVLAGASL